MILDNRRLFLHLFATAAEVACAAPVEHSEKFWPKSADGLRTTCQLFLVCGAGLLEGDLIDHATTKVFDRRSERHKSGLEVSQFVRDSRSGGELAGIIQTGVMRPQSGTRADLGHCKCTSIKHVTDSRKYFLFGCSDRVLEVYKADDNKRRPNGHRAPNEERNTDRDEDRVEPINGGEHGGDIEPDEELSHQLPRRKTEGRRQ